MAVYSSSVVSAVADTRRRKVHAIDLVYDVVQGCFVEEGKKSFKLLFSKRSENK